MKRDRLQEDLAALRAARDQPRAEQTLALLRRALTGRASSSFLVAAAAELVGEAGLHELLPLLPPAFERFLKEPESDKGCKAKTAIAYALYRCEHEDAALFRKGLRHVQKEPAWGGSQDTAGELRGVCALGLSRIPLSGVLCDLADLLADPDRTARAHAARAIGDAGLPEGVPLLRYKARIGDPEPEVLTECLGALLHLSRDMLSFVAGFLDRPEDEVRDAAAMALGQSRLDAALPLLRAFCDRLPGGERRVGLLAIALLRTPEALDELAARIERAPLAEALHAVRAAALHRYSAAWAQRGEAAVRRRGDPRLLRALDESLR